MDAIDDIRDIDLIVSGTSYNYDSIKLFEEAESWVDTASRLDGVAIFRSHVSAQSESETLEISKQIEFLDTENFLQRQLGLGSVQQYEFSEEDISAGDLKKMAERVSSFTATIHLSVMNKQKQLLDEKRWEIAYKH